MKIINITPIRKQKIIQMIKYLFPEYDEVVVRRKTNLVILKKKKFLFFYSKEYVPVTDIMITELPKRLDAALAENGFSDRVMTSFANLIDIILKSKSYNTYFDITDYYWEKFCKILKKSEKELKASEVILNSTFLIQLPLYLRNLNYLKIIIKEKLYVEKISIFERIRRRIAEIIRSTQLQPILN